ncbi:PEP-CTERM sorting domain-containing protein [Crocosphaera sp. XPORK-15E]|uniref:PEP-CTERM sorting domain-containing protein n=1 Tax=Crocosphaera sp. XPORK-15E TaxID=3110247 RepID=UPI002B2200DF|nr:PEP-CTERM sorting domain-containing protein [Crocosphaera sp. XPORK-15E]
METKPANALSFSFLQSGWDNGGEVSGMFSGEDGNNDNIISLSEVSSYMMSFSGNSTIGTFTHNLADLQSFDYQLGSSTILDISSNNGVVAYDGQFMIISQTPDSIETLEEVSVTQKVPEPTSLVPIIILGLGLCFKREKEQ